MKIYLIQQYYKNPNEDRMNEILYVLQKNISNPLIDHIYLLNEKEYEELPEHDKLTKIIINKRITFKDAFLFADKLEESSLKIFSNNDMSFDNTLNLLNNYDMDNKCLALTKYEVYSYQPYKYKFYSYPLSQDVWIFKKIKYITSLNIPLGYLGCDNRLIFELLVNHVKVENPSLDIKTYHNHLITNSRTYTDDNRLHGIYMGVKPHHLHVNWSKDLFEYLDRRYEHVQNENLYVRKELKNLIDWNYFIIESIQKKENKLQSHVSPTPIPIINDNIPV